MGFCCLEQIVFQEGEPIFNKIINVTKLQLFTCAGKLDYCLLFICIQVTFFPVYFRQMINEGFRHGES